MRWLLFVVVSAAVWLISSRMHSEGARIVRKLANRRADQRRPAARYAPPSPNQTDPRPAADQPWPNGSSTLLGSSPSAPFRLRTTAIAPGGRWTPHDRLLRLSLYRQELAQRPNQAKPRPPSEPQGQKWSTSNLAVSLLVHGSPSGPLWRLSALWTLKRVLWFSSRWLVQPP